MPYTLEYIEHEGGVIVTWTGTVKGPEVIRSYIERFAPPERLVKVRYIVTDYSQTTDFDMSVDDVKAIAQIANKAALSNRNIFGVAVMPSDLQFGVARMFQSYADDDATGWKTFVTRKLKDGQAWLHKNLDKSLTFNTSAD